ncbi:glycosyltransferase family 9 protein [Verrucomicrobiota bacterium sgz303538]
MKIFALQLKRIGDLILTTPALEAIKAAHSDAHVTLAVHSSTASLLPAIPHIDAGIVFGPGRGWTPWQQTLTGNFDHVLDFTGTDRSAAATLLSGARRRITFEWVRKNRMRALAYREFVPSSVRENHTVDHYLHLADSVTASNRVSTSNSSPASPTLTLPADAQTEISQLLATAGITQPFVLVHPGTARVEKYWFADRWGQVIAHIRDTLGLDVVVSGGRDPFEQAHITQIEASQGTQSRKFAFDGTPLPQSVRRGGFENFAGLLDLLTLSALVQRAQLVLSCDTAVVHLAASFQRPQIALFGPTNPFHWRPRHAGAVVLSAAQPGAPLTDFTSRMKGAPMDRLSTEVVIRATDALLSETKSSFS